MTSGRKAPIGERLVDQGLLSKEQLASALAEQKLSGRMLGEIFGTSEKPELKVSVRGTAPLKAVTIVRNEVNIRRFSPKDTAEFDATFTDEKPVVGENRYYVRVEQTDGNMGWTSPVWVTYKK